MILQSDTTLQGLHDYWFKQHHEDELYWDDSTSIGF